MLLLSWIDLITFTDVHDQAAFLQDKLPICQRFATDIIVPIGQVYKVSIAEVSWINEADLGGTAIGRGHQYLLGP